MILKNEDTRTNHNYDLAFIVVVVAAYLSTFSAALRFTIPEIAGLSLAGVVYAVMGIYGYAFCERTRSLPAIVIYFAIQVPLSAMVVYLSRGAGWVITLPLVSHNVVLLPRRWMLTICSMFVLAFVMFIGLSYGWAFTGQLSIQYLAAVVFVVTSTQIAVSERNARAEGERLATELGEANRKLREYAAQVEELAMAKERNRLAREIHDSLGHYLTAINMQIEACRAVMEKDRLRALDTLDKAQLLTREGLTDVRRSVAALRTTPTENRPLLEALATLVDKCRTAGVLTELIVSGTPRPLSAQAELTLYRAAQEGLTNVHKHARASHAELSLGYHDDAIVRLVIQDDGVGSDETQGGYGLLGVRERVKLLGGQVNIHSAKGQGFRFEVMVPG